MLSMKDVIGINKELSNGQMINKGSLEYAVKTQARSKNWLRTAAFFVRSILIDHVFEDGNKRTSAAVMMLIMEMNDVKYDPEEIAKIIVRLLMKNTISINEIERMIKNAVR